MKRKLPLTLCLFAAVLFSSCGSYTYTYRWDSTPSYEHIDYVYSGERPLYVDAGNTKNPSYHRIELYIRNNQELTKEKPMRSIRIDEYRVMLPFGRCINLLDSDIRLHYIYRSLREVEEEWNKLLWIQPQCIDGKRAIPIDGLGYDDAIRLRAHLAGIPALASRFRLEYAFTVVWEDGVEEKHSGTFRFKRSFDAKYWAWFTV